VLNATKLPKITPLNPIVPPISGRTTPTATARNIAFDISRNTSTVALSCFVFKCIRFFFPIMHNYGIIYLTNQHVIISTLLLPETGFRATMQRHMDVKRYIVTHANPDLDAVSSVWLIKRFWNGWETAEPLFVPAGETIDSYKKKAEDAYKYEGDFDNAEIVHVDTGLGMFDHHQDNRDTCAARLVVDVLVEAQKMQESGDTYRTDDGIIIQPRHFQEEALRRMSDHINDIDHFRQVYYPEATDDRYQFMLVDVLDGLNLLYNTHGTGDLKEL